MSIKKEDWSIPHLTNLNEDIQLSGKLYYDLIKETIFVGKKHANPQPQIILGGINILENHAKICLTDSDLVEELPWKDREFKLILSSDEA